jgi:hypothetical protein
MGQFLSALKQKEAAAWPIVVRPLIRANTSTLTSFTVAGANPGALSHFLDLNTNGRKECAQGKSFISFMIWVAAGPCLKRP